jgi:hypothetical protein
MHAVAPGAGWLPGRGAVVSGALAAALIFGLATGASAVIGCLEPPSLLAARRRWRRARADYEAAERTQQADLEAAAVASEAWLELIRVRVIKISAGDERLVKETTAVAAGMMERGRPQLRPAS